MATRGNALWDKTVCKMLILQREPALPHSQPQFSANTALPQTSRPLHLQGSCPQGPPFTSRTSELLHTLQAVSQVSLIPPGRDSHHLLPVLFPLSPLSL